MMRLQIVIKNLLLIIIILFSFNCNKEISIFEAARQGNIEKVDSLLAETDNIDAYEIGKNLVCIAVDTGNVELLRLLIVKGANVSVECNSELQEIPLLRAVKQNRVEIVEELFQHKKAIYSDMEHHDMIGLSIFDYVRTPAMRDVLHEHNVNVTKHITGT